MIAVHWKMVFNVCIYHNCSFSTFPYFPPFLLSPFIFFFLHYLFIVCHAKFTELLDVLPSELFDFVSWYAELTKFFYVLPLKFFYFISYCDKGHRIFLCITLRVICCCFLLCKAHGIFLCFTFGAFCWFFLYAKFMEVFFSCGVELVKLLLFLSCKAHIVSSFLVV